MDKITLEGIACGYVVTETNQLPNGLKKWEGIAWFQNPCKPSIILKLKHRLLKYNNHIQRESGSVYATEFRWRENMMIGCKFEGAGPLVKWKDGPIPIIKKEKPKMGTCKFINGEPKPINYQARARVTELDFDNRTEPIHLSQNKKLDKGIIFGVAFFLGMVGILGLTYLGYFR